MTQPDELPGFPVPVRRSLVDGVTVFSAPADGETSATLSFRVGMIDETLTTSGITHLVEHLAMPAHSRHVFEVNARVEGVRTLFWGHGEEQEVAGFLRGICAALRSLPLERFEAERRMRRDSVSGHELAAQFLVLRHGGSIRFQDLLYRGLDFLKGGAKAHGKDNRYRPRHDQLLCGRARGRRAGRHPECGGRAHDAVRRRVHEGRPAARRGARKAPAGHEPAEHDLLDQAVHGPQVRRGLGGDEDRPLRGRQGPERRRARDGGGQGVHPAGDQRDDPAEAEGRRRVVPRRDGHRRGDHRPGLLQQRAARGDEGRRQGRRPQRAPHHQRADRGVARVRARQGRRGPDDPRLRPRRRHVRRVGARARGGRLRGEVDERGQPPRRRQLRQGGRRLDGRRVQARPGHRPGRGQDGAAASLRGGGEGEDRALVHDDDADQPSVRHRDAGRPEAPRPAADAREARGDHRRPARAHGRPDEAGTHRRRARRVEDRTRDPRRRHDPHARRAGEGEGADRQGPAQGREPGRGRRRRRRDPGGRAQGRGEGHPLCST